MTLAKKAAYGIAWVTLSSILIRVFNFATKIILARLLAPADFGLLAIGLLAINSMGLLRDLGFGAALIYKKDDSDHTAANTAFMLLPIIASVLFVLAYLSAPYVAMFFDTAAVEPIVRVLALTFIISSFGTVPSMLLEKELEFKKKVLPETVPVAGYACVTIGLALHGYGVWSLVYGQIVSAVLMAVLIWVVSDWRPTFKFDRGVARELFGYGKHILGASVVIFLITNIDDAIIGRMLGMEALGFYTMAYTISNLPATQITHLVSRVMFPAYSKLQDDRDALRRAYLKTLKYVSMLSIPAAFGIFVIAPDFVSVVLGVKWMPAVPALQVLCFFGLSRSIAATTGSIFQATGRPEILLKTSFIQLIVMVLLIYPLVIRYGIVGVGLAVTIPIFIQAIVQVYIVHRILHMNFKDVYITMFPTCLSSIIMTICLLLLKNKVYGLFHICSVNALILSVLTGIITYITILYIFDKNLIYDIKKL
uniref:Lipid II flippase MurJ n=1 Tax=Candidatus Methanogaster sp. ANME-2c ERB4 TaxID=2759911 RepID=A0A7G9Y405_9EURY|nr:lipid II flippase MurJ [Methanosarcinales archaeon ANME-2c ERB4]QNO42739.1 lipid II flippase MurJ [Methanosarcinales archaeon ANME-2c ERB4]